MGSETRDVFGKLVDVSGTCWVVLGMDLGLEMVARGQLTVRVGYGNLFLRTG